MVTARKTAAAMMHGEHMTDGGEENPAKDKVKTITIPIDVVYEIFSWLPAKSILKFKSCSKFTYEFTKEKDFLVKHAQNVTLQGDSSVFIQGVHIIGGVYRKSRTEIRSLPGNKASSSGIPKRFLRLISQRPVRILSSSNGLLLCEVLPKGGSFFREKPKGELIICNPTTQSFSSIGVTRSFEENYDNTYITLAFGSLHDKEYELLLFECYLDQKSEYVVCKAYKPKEGVWKERQKGLLMGYSWALLCSYFDEGKCRSMLLYNFESGKMKRLLFPKEPPNFYETNLFQYHGVRLFKRDKVVGTSSDDICLVIWDKDDLVFTLWVLIDYESSRWSKFLTLNLEEMGLNEKDLDVRGYALMNGNCLVFATKKNVYRYNLNDERGTRLEKIGWHTLHWGLNIFSYSSTLLPCGANARKLDKKSYI